MVSRSLKPEEQDLDWHGTAWDGVGVILHVRNPVAALSRQQMVDIYTGKITNWNAAGKKYPTVYHELTRLKAARHLSCF